MTPELTVLTLAALLQCLQFALMAVPANWELGTGKTASPRDLDRLGKPMIELLSVKTARLARAMNNHFEALILFGIAITVVSLSDQTNAITTACAWTYLGARILYIPAYYFGWTPWRSAIWFVGFLSTLVILITALL
ncbi:MAG: MAPEG family protein [Yoonia sp.]|mgnify:CR=1 FL=1|jgi:uncharacterized MAPEG superfamily protein|nr:MAPEG family protein [Yoonia sp.]